MDRKENPWFNEICQKKKKKKRKKKKKKKKKRKKRYIFLQKLNLFRQNKNFESRVAMTRARSDYKRVIRQARYDYDTHKTLRLEQAQCFYAKLYLKKS